MDADTVKEATVALHAPIEDAQGGLVGRELDCIVQNIEKCDTDEAAVTDE